jgi:hypothetical protein
VAGEQQRLGGANARFVKPVLRRLAKQLLEITLKLPRGEAAQSGKIAGVVLGL